MQKTVLCSPFCWPWPQKSHRLSSPWHGVKGLKCKLSSQCLSSERPENKFSQGTSISSNAPKKAAKSSWTAIWKQLVWAHRIGQPQKYRIEMNRKHVEEISSQFRLQTYPCEHCHGRMYEKCSLIFACIGQNIAYITPWTTSTSCTTGSGSPYEACLPNVSAACPQHCLLSLLEGFLQWTSEATNHWIPRCSMVNSSNKKTFSDFDKAVESSLLSLRSHLRYVATAHKLRNSR